MNDLAKIKFFPKRSLKAYDGMSVTADIWEMAHNEHRDEMRSHLLSMHKPGIICGLEIRANDPADHYVFISPGAAVDELGHIIIVDQTIAYDFGDEGAGSYKLLLGYTEHEKEISETKTKVMQHEYIIAARQTLPKQPVVELARVLISGKGSSIRDAKDPYQPKKDELDLRYRNDNPNMLKRIHVGVITFPSDNDRVYTSWRVLIREMETMLRAKLVVDLLPEIDDRINSYDMIYIGAAGVFELNNTQTTVLKNFYNNGKGLLLESLDPEGGKTLRKFADSLKAVQADPEKVELFHQPFFFRVPPEQITANRLFCAEKLVFCNAPITSPWSGELNEELLHREEIRTNLEWGANLVTYCAG